MSECLLYKYNNKIELVNTHMTTRKEWWCSGNNIYPNVHRNKPNITYLLILMYRINITINENKETNILSGIFRETKRISNNNAIILLLSRFLTAVFKTFILKVVRRFTTWFHEISKSQDRGLNITNRSEIWQAHLWQYCRDVSWISERCNDYDIASCGFESKASYKIHCNTIESMNPLPPKF